MKIAVSGAHKVGKTTLIENLKESFPEYECKAEAYYELEETGFVFSDIPVYEDYIILLEHSIEQIDVNETNIIFDRCPADYLAYIQASNDSENLNIQSLYQRVRETMNEIDLLVFVPVEKPDLIVCPESELPELRHKVNEILNDWVRDFNSNVLEVTGSPSSRRDQVIKYLSKQI